MEHIALYLKSIRCYYPELPLDQVKEIGSGQNNVILQIGSDLIFRFPRYAIGIEQLKLEIQLLNIIKTCFSECPSSNLPILRQRR